MNKSCFLCKGELIESTNTYFIEIDSKILIVKNVPCLKCSQCGEVTYSFKTAKRLEEIVNAVRGSLSELEILNYSNKVA
jgi:YgiT-type zinc finger domain-containing protein